jgi:dTDP-L-rhamnose 4-epimerase
MILVTGGAGFIGSHIVEALTKEGLETRVLDARLGGDVTDAATVRRALHGVDAVCHQAAMVGLGQDMLDIADYSRNNDFGTAVLLRELAAVGFAGRLVLASSMVVYGEGRYHCESHGARRAAPRDPADLEAGLFEPRCPDCGEALAPVPIDESAPLDPRSVYAATKVHQEHLCFCFAHETGVPVTALRYHNVYGPRMPRDTPYAGVAALFASALAAGRAPRVFEDGRQLRDFVHVRDVARANVLALTTRDPVPGPLNVASGQPRSVGELAAALHGAAGRDAPPPVVTGEFRLGDVRHVFASVERAERVLGFRAREPFEASAVEFVSPSLRAA